MKERLKYDNIIGIPTNLTNIFLVFTQKELFYTITFDTYMSFTISLQLASSVEINSRLRLSTVGCVPLRWQFIQVLTVTTMLIIYEFNQLVLIIYEFK
jgi:hypothetical protein